VYLKMESFPPFGSSTWEAPRLELGRFLLWACEHYSLQLVCCSSVWSPTSFSALSIKEEKEQSEG